MNLPGLPPATLEPAAPAPQADEVIVTTAHKGPVNALETATIGYLVTAGKSVAEVAEILGRSPETIARHLPMSKKLMQAFLPEMLGYWRDAAMVQASKGKHEAARDWVYAAGAAVAHGPQGPAGPSMVVQIGVSLPGLPAPQAPQALPDIDVQHTGPASD